MCILKYVLSTKTGNLEKLALGFKHQHTSSRNSVEHYRPTYSCAVLIYLFFLLWFRHKTSVKHNHVLRNDTSLIGFSTSQLCSLKPTSFKLAHAIHLPPDGNRQMGSLSLKVLHLCSVASSYSH